MTRAILGAGFIGLVAATLSACATTGAAMSADDAIAKRQALMKEQGAAMRRIQDNHKAGNLQGIGADAEVLTRTARQIPELFPQGSLDPKTSRARPEIWQKWSEFEGTAKLLETKANQLSATAKTGDAQATGTAIADLGKTTCGACHSAFRGPEIKR